MKLPALMPARLWSQSPDAESKDPMSYHREFALAANEELLFSEAYMLFLQISRAQHTRRRGLRELVTRNHTDIVPARQLGRCLLNFSRDHGVHPIRAYVEGEIVDQATETTELVPVNNNLPKRVDFGSYLFKSIAVLPDSEPIDGGTLTKSTQAEATESIRATFERSDDRSGDTQVFISSSAFCGIERSLEDLLAGLERTAKGWNITGAYHVNPPIESDAGYYTPRPPEDVPVLPDNSNCADCVIINSRNDNLLY